jgi:hypothetical protein
MWRKNQYPKHSGNIEKNIQLMKNTKYSIFGLETETLIYANNPDSWTLLPRVY